MKVIQVGAFFHPSVGGVERQMEEIAVHLAQAGIDVRVFTTDASHDHTKRMQRLVEENYRGLRVYRYRYQLALGNFFRFSLGLVWQLWTADYDLLHVHNIHDGHALPAIVIGFLRKKKVIFTGHNPFIVGSQKRGERLHQFVSFYDRVFKLFSRHVSGYIALLEQEKQFVIEQIGIAADKITVIPNGIEDLYYQQLGDGEKFWNEWEINPDKWKLIVGTASRLNYVKGLQNLKEAVAKLPKVLFVFVGGDDGYYQTLRGLYRDADNVMFTERYLPANEIRNFYASIDLFLLPSVYEPFGMTVVEAMAQHKPVLASSNGGTTEIVQPEFGELLDPNSHELWYQRIKEYADNKEKLAEMGTRAAQAAKQYSWEVVMPRIISFYDKVLTTAK